MVEPTVNDDALDIEVRPVRSALAEWNGIQIIDTDRAGDGDTLFTLTTARKDDLRPELFRLAVEEGWTMTELYREKANLEDVFRHLTTE